MKEYKKPQITTFGKANGVVPAALGAAALSVGGAFAVGVASGLMKDEKGFDRTLPALDKVEIIM